MTKFLFLFLVVGYSIVYAQDLVIKESCLDHKQGTPNREAAHSYFHEESNTLYLTFMGKHKMYLNTYVDMKKISEYGFDRTEDAGLFNQVSDAVLKKGEEYYLFFANPTCAEFSVQSINLIDKSIVRKPQALILEKDEFYLYSFTEKGDFYVFTSVKKTSNTRIYKYNYSSGKFDAHVVNLDAITFPYLKKKIQLWNVFTTDNSRIIINADAFKYSKDATLKSVIDPKIVSRAMKFYNREGHLLVTIDGYNNRTYLINIDLDTYLFKYSDFEFDKIGALSSETQKNSYVFENMLLQVKVSPDKLISSVTDLNTKERIKTYTCESSDSAIYFANSPFVKVTTEKSLLLGEIEKERDLKYRIVKRMLRILSDANVFIGAIRNEDNTIEIMFGSYFHDLPRILGMPQIPSPAAVNTTPPIEVLYYFTSLANQDFSAQLSTYSNDSFYEYLHKRQNEISCPSNAQTIFNINKSYYLGYFLSKSQYEANKEDDGIKDFYCVEKLDISNKK